MEDKKQIGALLLILDKDNLNLQPSLINLSAEEALQIIRAFNNILQDAVIEQAKEKARQEILNSKA